MAGSEGPKGCGSPRPGFESSRLEPSPPPLADLGLGWTLAQPFIRRRRGGFHLSHGPGGRSPTALESDPLRLA